MVLRSPTKRNKNNIIEAQKGLMRPKLPWQRHPQPQPQPQPHPAQHHSHVQVHNATATATMPHPGASLGIPVLLWALLAMATNRIRVQLPVLDLSCA